jgi:hypothetical protein
MSALKDYSPRTGPSYTSVAAGQSALNSLATGGVQFTPLTAAQIIAMFTTPVAITPVPGTGKAVVVEMIIVELILTSTQFSGGGVVKFQYHGQTTELMATSIAAATVNATVGSYVFVLQPVATAGGSVVTPAVAAEITNLTGVFAAGTGTAKIWTVYRTITL